MISKFFLFTIKRFAYIGSFAYFVPLLIADIFDHQFGLPTFYINSFLAVAVFAVAVFLIFAGLVTLTKYGNGTVNPQRPPKRLVTKGIYSHTRHPIYLGWILSLLAAALFYGSLSLLAISVLLAPFIHRHAVREEASLSKAFGKSYIEYKKKVARWVPRLI